MRRLAGHVEVAVPIDEVVRIVLAGAVAENVEALVGGEGLGTAGIGDIKGEDRLAAGRKDRAAGQRQPVGTPRIGEGTEAASAGRSG